MHADSLCMVKILLKIVTMFNCIHVHDASHEQ